VFRALIQGIGTRTTTAPRRNGGAATSVTILEEQMKVRRLWSGPVLVLGLVVVALLVAAGCGSSSSGGGTTTTPATTPAATATGGTSKGGATVTIQNFAFTPSTLNIAVGTTVTWTNKDAVPHDVTSADGISTTANTTSMFTSGSLNQGQTFSFTFTKAGTYFYECRIHKANAAMHATVVVK
jgi:plastocyanin